MLLAIDVGNTLIRLGLWEGERLRARWSLTTSPARTGDEYAVVLTDLLRCRGLSPEQVSGCVAACVVPSLTQALRRAMGEYWSLEPLFVSAGLDTGLAVLTDDPAEVGPDRIANSVAARDLYGAPAIVIDFSTATTFDAISAEGAYVGDAIAPGLGSSAEALFRFAAQLYRVELRAPGKVTATSTVEAVQAGLIYGHACLVEGMVARFQRELGGRARLVATGEYAELMAPELPFLDHVDPDLALFGLRRIYERLLA